nr:MAG TPA: desulfoferrodoxin [Caudoviricetes sp.]
MKDYRIFRCKRCGQEIITKDFEVLGTGQLERILSADTDTLFVFNGNEIIHHCNKRKSIRLSDKSVGICELVGYEAEE